MPHRQAQINSTTSLTMLEKLKQNKFFYLPLSTLKSLMSLILPIILRVFHNLFIHTSAVIITLVKLPSSYSYYSSGQSSEQISNNCFHSVFHKEVLNCSIKSITEQVCTVGQMKRTKYRGEESVCNGLHISVYSLRSINQIESPWLDGV